jgi:general secretion pathway protein L
MSVLVLQIPPRTRLGARVPGGEAPTVARAGADWAYALSADGLTVERSGHAAPALLPRADSTVAVLHDADVSWHRIPLPKAPAARLRAALVGAMEEMLLEEDPALHFALAPDAVAGQPTWVAVIDKRWLAAEIAALEAAGLVIDRIVPASAPTAAAGEAAQGHFFASADEAGAAAEVQLAYSDNAGAACLRLAGTLPRALWASGAGAAAGGAGATPPVAVWTASPAAAGAAERWLGAPVALQSEAERSLQASRSRWDLRQFDLARRHRGTLALRDIGRRLVSPEWRPVRWAAAALVGVQVLALNAWAWQQQARVEQLRAAQVAVLRAAHPQVRAVLDAPLQMQRETELLRAAAGRPGDADLEALLSAAAAAWPEGIGPISALKFEPGKLTFSAPGWGEAQNAAFRERLRAGGWSVDAAEGRVTVAADAPAASARALP